VAILIYTQVSVPAPEFKIDNDEKTEVDSEWKGKIIQFKCDIHIAYKFA
jgi:hypothetical protein